MKVKKIQIKEMAPRDGLQNEKRIYSTDEKLALIEKLGQAGIMYIEATAFVSPKAIPQLADAEEVMKRLKKKKGVTYAALVPNLKGIERAISCGVDEVAVFTAASETFNQKNINTSIEGSFERFKDVFPLAKNEKMKVRGYVSTSFYCPFEGKIESEKVLFVVERLLEMGCYEVSIGDTIGKATVADVDQLFSVLLKKFKPNMFAGHFHDTFGNAIQNVLKSFEMGIATFDSSAGGIGGCPYAPGAKGNVSTEELVRTFEKMGVSTGVQFENLGT